MSTIVNFLICWLLGFLILTVIGTNFVGIIVMLIAQILYWSTGAKVIDNICQ